MVKSPNGDIYASLDAANEFLSNMKYCFLLGLDVDGIYRVSGNLAVIQKLRFAVNHDEKLDLNDSKWEDIHVITGALKMFFRELPEPLFTFNHFNDFVNAISKSAALLSFFYILKSILQINYCIIQSYFILFIFLRQGFQSYF